jgi:hypothetical protein
MSDQTAVVPVKPKVPVAMSHRGVELVSMDDAWRFCEAIAGTDIAPKGMGAKAIFGVIQAGAELGLSPLRALANMKIINGRVGPMGALAKALVRQANVLQKGTGFKQDFTGTEMEDDWTAHITTFRADETDVVTTSFSVKDAKRAALWGKDTWKKYPRRMLMWRAVGFHMDDQFSEILMGFHIAEVLDDYPEERIAATMEPVAVPARDPLLDELEVIGATMQPPPLSEEDTKEDPNPDPTLHPIITDPIEEPVNLETGEFLSPVGQSKPVSPLSAVMAEKEAEQPPMTEEEAMRDLIEEGVVKEEELAQADPGNAAEEGEDPDLGF